MEDLADPQLARADPAKKLLVRKCWGGVRDVLEACQAPSEKLSRDTKLLNGCGGLCINVLSEYSIH